MSINTMIIQSLNIENSILKHKVETLSQLCEHHKSKYEQLSAKYKYELDYQRYKFETEIDALKSKLSTQSLQIISNEHQIAKLKQERIKSENNHKKQMSNMQQSLHQRFITIDKLQQQIKDKNFEISMLKLDAAENAMHMQYAQYAQQQAISNCVFNDNNSNGSPSTTIAINAAHTISYTFPHSLLSCAPKPNSLSSWKQQYLRRSSIRPKPYKPRTESANIFDDDDNEVMDSLSESSEMISNPDAIDSDLDKADDEIMAKPSPLLILKSRSSFSSAMLTPVTLHVLYIYIRIYFILVYFGIFRVRHRCHWM